MLNRRLMFNGMMIVAIVGTFSFGIMQEAQAATHRHGHADRGHVATNNVRVASLADNFCYDRPWTCGGGENWGSSAWDHTTVRAVHQGHVRVSERHRHRGTGTSLNDLIAALRTKVSEIISGCGSRLVSGYRPGAHVAGSGRLSLHSTYPARAADLSGNPSCIYSHLHGWAGGYSIDYGRVRHVHLSYSPPGSGELAGREWHARFAHYAGGHHRGYAHHHHRRYASR